MLIVVILYGCLLLSGAYFGRKAGSKVSMIMGLITGTIILCAAGLLNANPQAGYLVVSAVSSFLSVVFLIRLIKTKKMMPAGALLGASAVVLVLSLFQLSA